MKLSRYPNWLMSTLQLLLLLGLYFTFRAWQQTDLIRGEAPNIAAQTLDGRYFTLSESRQSPLLLHFWATWCSVCRLQQGNISNIAEDWTVMTVAMQPDGAQQIKQYLVEHHLDIPVIVDEQGIYAKQFGVRAVPTSFVINPSGDIRFLEMGYTTELGLRARLWWASLGY